MLVLALVLLLVVGLLRRRRRRRRLLLLLLLLLLLRLFRLLLWSWPLLLLLLLLDQAAHIPEVLLGDVVLLEEPIFQVSRVSLPLLLRRKKVRDHRIYWIAEVTALAARPLR